MDGVRRGLVRCRVDGRRGWDVAGVDRAGCGLVWSRGPGGGPTTCPGVVEVVRCRSLGGGRVGDLDGGCCVNVKLARIGDRRGDAGGNRRVGDGLEHLCFSVKLVRTGDGKGNAGGNRLVGDGLKRLYEGRDSHRGLEVCEAGGRR